MLDDLISDKRVFLPLRDGFGDFVAGDGYAKLSHVVDETAEGMAGGICLLLVLGIYFDGDWKYLHGLFVDRWKRSGAGCQAVTYR